MTIAIADAPTTRTESPMAIAQDQPSKRTTRGHNLSFTDPAWEQVKQLAAILGESPSAAVRMAVRKLHKEMAGQL